MKDSVRDHLDELQKLGRLSAHPPKPPPVLIDWDSAGGKACHSAVHLIQIRKKKETGELTFHVVKSRVLDPSRFGKNVAMKFNPPT